MSERSGNLFTQDNIDEIIGSLQVDIGADDHNVFQAKITAMQRLLRHGMSKFSKDKLYQHLCIVARRLTVQDRMRTWDTRPKSVILSVNHLREVVSDLHGKEKYNGLLECERQAIRYFQHFFIDVEHIRSFKDAYDREVHTVLYYDYYKPQHSGSSKKISAKRKGDKPEDEDSGNYSLSELDEKHEQAKSLKPPKTGSSSRSSGSPRGDMSPRNKCDDTLSQVGFSVSKHLDGSEREKLDVTVDELKVVSERWDRLLLEDEQEMEDYDPESYYEVMEMAEHTKFESVFRLFPDIFAKCYKVIELSKQWWNLAHKIYKKLPLGRPVSRAWPKRPTRTPRVVSETDKSKEDVNNELTKEVGERDTGKEGTDESDVSEKRQQSKMSEPLKQQKHDRIRNIKAHLFDLSYTIRELDEELTHCKVELRKLDSRERRFQMLEILHGKVDANLEELQEKCRKLRAQRKVIAQKYSYTFRGTEKYFEYREKLRRMDKQLLQYDQDLQLLVYKQTVVDQDYMLEMEIRPNFIRSYDDLRTNIIETEYLLQERTSEKKQLEEELELLEPDGVAGKSRRGESGSNSGHSDVSGFRRETTQSQSYISEEDRLERSLNTVSRNSGDSMFQEVFNGLGKRFELVNSAPPVKTQLRQPKKAETKQFHKPLPPKSEHPQKSVTTIDGSKLGVQDKSRFHSPRPPPAAMKKRPQKQVSGRRGVKPAV